MMLRDKHIVVTRAQRQAVSFIDKLLNDGAQVFELPLIEIGPVPEARCPHSLSEFNWLVVTSANAVHYFGNCLRVSGKSYADLHHCQVAAIGRATANALREEGLEVQVIPDTHVSEFLVKALLERESSPEKKRVLLPLGNLAQSDITKELEAAGMQVLQITCYKTLFKQPDQTEIERMLDFSPDVITFFSPSAVSAFAEGGLMKRLSESLLRPLHVSIGPVTTRALNNNALKPLIEASYQTEDGMIQAMKDYFLHPPP